MANISITSHLNPQFPTHNAPRVWLLTSGDSPVGISLTRQLLEHGDQVVSGIDEIEFEENGYRGQQFKLFLTEVGKKPEWKERLKIIALDIRSVSSCQAAVASAIYTFRRIDILFCCTNQAYIGTIEEFSQPQRSHGLVRDQFESNFFGPMNIIRTVIPEMRRKTHGHIMLLTGIFGHIGTPGLGMFCASTWAIEGFCDSIAYEIAPFNIKLTIVQSSIEIGLLTNKITSAPPMYEYSPDSGNNAPLFRNLLDGLLSRLPQMQTQHSSPSHEDRPSSSSSSSSRQSLAHEPQADLGVLTQDRVVSLYPPLGEAHTEKLVAETIHAITAIGGHENPPARHIVGVEGVASVKEKLRTVSEELEEFVDVSIAVDIRHGQKRRRSMDKIEKSSKDTVIAEATKSSNGHTGVHPDVYEAAMVFQAL